MAAEFLDRLRWIGNKVSSIFTSCSVRRKVLIYLPRSPSLLRKSIPLAISLQRAIVRQGSSILEKNAVKYFTAFRFTKITEGPDLAIFAHPNTLTRLTQWLVEALRDRIPTEYKQRLDRAGKKGYPFVVACLNERTNSFLVVGVTSARDMHDIRKKCVLPTFACRFRNRN